MNKEKVKTFEDIIKKNHPNICGVVVLKDDKLVYENYENNCNKESKIHIYSVTKSIISLLIGIALDKGYIKDINQKILAFFPYYKKDKSNKTIENITLKDMLTMTAPFKYKDAPYIDYFTSSDYLKFSLDMLGGDNEIGSFFYTPLIGPDIFSGIIKNTTNQSVLEFATKNLFEPLDIIPPKNITFKSEKEQIKFNQSIDKNNWVAGTNNLNTAGWGLCLSTIDMAKIGQLYLNCGVYNCKRIVSTKWIKESTSPHINLGDLSYGYLWWILDDHSFVAMGDGGNSIYVDTKDNIVIAISAFFVPNSSEKIELIKHYIKPAFE